MGASKEVLHSAQIVACSKESEMVLPFKHLQFKIKIKIKPEDRDWKIHWSGTYFEKKRNMFRFGEKKSFNEDDLNSEGLCFHG